MSPSFADFNSGVASADQSGSIDGFSLGAPYSYTYAKSQEFYSWLVGIFLSGDCETKKNGESSHSIFSRDDSVTYYNSSSVVNYQALNILGSSHNFSVIFGPFITFYNFSQTYENNNESLNIEMEA